MGFKCTIKEYVICILHHVFTTPSQYTSIINLFLCLFIPILSNHLVHSFNFSRYALMALSISSVSVSSLNLFDRDTCISKEYFKHNISKTELLMFSQSLHSVLVFPILKWIHYLLSLFGSKLRDHFFKIFFYNHYNPRASPFDSSFVSYPDKHVWQLYHSNQVTVISHVDYCSRFYPLLSFVPLLTNFIHSNWNNL